MQVASSCRTRRGEPGGSERCVDTNAQWESVAKSLRWQRFCQLLPLLVFGLVFNLPVTLGQELDRQAIESPQPEAPTLVVPRVSQRFSDLFDVRQYRYTGGVYDDHLFKYRLFVPEIAPEREYPIVVWLHGHGEAGSDNAMHLAWLGERMMLPPWERQRFPYFVLCVPCLVDNDLWNGAPAGTDPDKRVGSDMISVTDAILADVLEQFPIDRKRVYVSGVSGGGTGAWEYAMRWPERFAAVAPLAGTRVGGDYSPLKNVPVWVFHSTHDTAAPIAGARHNAASLRAAGGYVKLTEIDTVSHDCWTAAFGEHQLLNWMLAQRKGEAIVMDIRPWQRQVSDTFGSWTVTQLVGQLVVVGLVGAGGIVALKRMRGVR